MEIGGDLVNPSVLAIIALLTDAVLCAGWAERADTFIISAAILTAALIVTLREEKYHGQDH